MKRFYSILSAAVLCIVAASCSKINGEGGTVAEERTVTGYDGISLALDANITYTQDSVYTLVLQGQQNILDKIETVVQNGKLVIKYEDHVVIGTHSQISAVIHAPGVNRLDISGSGDLQVVQPWTVYSGHLNISGSGNLSVSDVTAHDINANISGSGNIKGSAGNCYSAVYTISGSGSLDMLGVNSDSAWATISGSGDIRLAVSKYLNATISGSGNILYFGNPVIETHISGSGNVSYIQPL
jgi:hypothetical protein